MPTDSATEIGITAKDTKTQPVLPGDMQWRHIAILGVWHVGIIIALLLGILQAWPKIVSPSVPPFSAEDLIVKPGKQPADTTKVIIEKLKDPKDNSVLAGLKTDAKPELLKDYPTTPPGQSSTGQTTAVAPLEDRTPILIEHLNKKLSDREFAKLGNSVPEEEVRRHNRQKIEEAFFTELQQSKRADTQAGYEGQREQNLLMIVIAFGAMGACIRAGIFFVGYTGEGTARRSWTMYYILQPFVGAVLSLIFYCVFRGGLVAQSSIQTGNVNLFFISGLAGLVGIFSKNALDRMELWFASFAAPSPGAGGSATQKTKSVITEEKTTPVTPAKTPTITGFDPDRLSKAANPPNVIITGTNFAEGAVVRFDATSAPKVMVDNAQQITASLPADVLQKQDGAEVKVIVELPGAREGDPKIASQSKSLKVVS